MVEQELARIEQVLTQGIGMVEKGQFRRAVKLAKTLEKSWAVSEAIRAQVIIEAYALLRERKPKKAKARCLKSMRYLWNNEEGLFLIRQSNKRPGPESSFYDLAFNGGSSMIGPWTEDYYCRFLILANSLEQAIEFAKEVGKFQGPDSPAVVEQLRQTLSLEDQVDKLGIYRCSPFTLKILPEPFLEILIPDGKNLAQV